MSKIAFVVLVVLFGVLMFIAGLLAPASLKTTFSLTAQHWLPASAVKLLTPAKSIMASAAPSASTISLPTATAKPATASAGTPASAPAVPLSSVMVPVSPAANTVYALQIALVASAGQASDSAAPLTDAQVPVKVLNVTDSEGKPWVLVAAGNYSSYDDARIQQTVLAQQFHLLDLPPVIVLPPAKPAA